MQHLKIYNKEDILSLTKIRRFETKLGERLQVVNDAGDIAKSLAASNAKYVLFGIPEDLGAKGNLGIGGTDRKSTRLNSSHPRLSRMPSSA